ncbi:unnamed protein product [Orchesella dallaii]|uniref:Uncharacterized protein n=1 Tax=Orchesella dallaii TaxID=48710 RepID=A0ABP1RNQ2_9HEXA
MDLTNLKEIHNLDLSSNHISDNTSRIYREKLQLAIIGRPKKRKNQLVKFVEVKMIQPVLLRRTREEMKRTRNEAHVMSKRRRLENASVESAPSGLPNGWWAKYQPTDILAIDCEHVHYRTLKGRERVKAGSVSVVDYRGEQIYYAEIKHERGSFLVNKCNMKVNGFNENSLVNGKDLEVVMAEVGALF